MGKVHKRTMTAIKLGDVPEIQQFSADLHEMVERATEVWERIRPLYEGREIDSKRADAMCLAVLHLAELHPDFDRWTRSRRTSGKP